MSTQVRVDGSRGATAAEQLLPAQDGELTARTPRVADGGPLATFAARLNWLFDNVTSRPGVLNSNRQIARFVAQHTGESCSAEYIAQLRKGHRDNPTKRVLEALAAFFDVSAGYFVDDAYADQIQAQIELLFSLRESDLRFVALRDLMLTLRDHADRLGVDDLRLLEDVVRSISSRSTVATGEAPPVR